MIKETFENFDTTKFSVNDHAENDHAEKVECKSRNHMEKLYLSLKNK